MTTKNIEKEFRIEVIASLLENVLLKNEDYDVNEDDIYELTSFISGLYINRINFYYLGGKVKNILLELHPELNIRINKKDNFLYDDDISAILCEYKKNFGDNYKIKSIKKCLVKSFKIQDK